MSFLLSPSFVVLALTLLSPFPSSSPNPTRTGHRCDGKGHLAAAVALRKETLDRYVQGTCKYGCLELYKIDPQVAEAKCLPRAGDCPSPSSFAKLLRWSRQRSRKNSHYERSTRESKLLPPPIPLWRTILLLLLPITRHLRLHRPLLLLLLLLLLHQLSSSVLNPLLLPPSTQHTRTLLDPRSLPHVRMPNLFSPSRSSADGGLGRSVATEDEVEVARLGGEPFLEEAGGGGGEGGEEGAFEVGGARGGGFEGDLWKGEGQLGELTSEGRG